MIEIIYNETKKGIAGNEDIFHIPNNIRQIGESKEHLKIYMEDYAYTYLKRISRQDTEAGCVAILLGEAKWKDSVSYIFVHSALEIEGSEITAEHMPFTDSVWGEVHKDIEKYFPDQEIIGWVLSLPGFNMKINDMILRAHLDHFSGSQKVLFVMEPTEKEEAFFVYENNQLNRQSGYYIYYEKNEAMQSYMIEKSGNSSIEETERVSDRAVIDFRKIVAGKKEEEEKSQGFAKKLLYTVSACSIVALLALGITYFNNYRNIDSVVNKVTKTSEVNESEIASTDSAQETGAPEISKAADVKNNETANSGGNKSAQEENTDEKLSAGKPTATPTPTEAAPKSPTSGDLDAQISADNSADVETDDLDNGAQSADVSTTPSPQQKETATAGYNKYVVKKGDTLTQISEDYYGTIGKIREICDINKLTSEDIIYAGQIILLP